MDFLPSKETRELLAVAIREKRKGISLADVAREAGTTIQHTSLAEQCKPIPLSVYIKLIKWVRNDEIPCPKPHPLLTDFTKWHQSNDIDTVSRKVLRSLVIKYIDGDCEPLFGKFKSLEERGFYGLCKIFKSCLVYLNLNEEYLEWR